MHAKIRPIVSSIIINTEGDCTPSQTRCAQQDHTAIFLILGPQMSRKSWSSWKSNFIDYASTLILMKHKLFFIPSNISCELCNIWPWVQMGWNQRDVIVIIGHIDLRRQLKILISVLFYYDIYPQFYNYILWT